MKDIAGQEINLGDRVAIFADGSTVVHIGRVVETLGLTNRVEVAVELVSMNYGVPIKPVARYSRVRAGRYRVIVMKEQS